MNLTESFKKIKKFLQKQEDVILAYFYGSRAEGFPRENSDLDIAVLLDTQKSPAAFYGRGVRLSCELEDLVKPLTVDVRELNSAPPFFCFQVLKTGQLLYSRDENQRAEFENRTRNKYFDLRDMYEQFYQDMIKRLKGGEFGVRSKTSR